jgi:hypothetical protein
MTIFKKYSDVFGKPDTGIHKTRFMNIAVWDVIATVVAGVVIAKLFNINVLYTVVSLFIIGIIMHRLFAVRTTVDTILF